MVARLVVVFRRETEGEILELVKYGPCSRLRPTRVSIRVTAGIKIQACQSEVGDFEVERFRTSAERE